MEGKGRQAVVPTTGYSSHRSRQSMARQVREEITYHASSAARRCWAIISRACASSSSMRCYGQPRSAVIRARYTRHGVTQGRGMGYVGPTRLQDRPEIGAGSLGDGRRARREVLRRISASAHTNLTLAVLRQGCNVLLGPAGSEGQCVVVEPRTLT